MYNQYIHYLRGVISTGDISTFKSAPAYREILEHCSVAFGEQFYDFLRKDYQLSDETIVEFCMKNDAIGSPITHTIRSLPCKVSPASLLYLYHAMVTLDHLLSLDYDTIDIVEVGCGYGGYILALDYVSRLRNVTISSYTCIDLDEPLGLQQLYLRNFTTSFPIDFHSATTYGKAIAKKDMFLTSIYCFSEIEKQHQIGYIQHLFPKVSHGFMIWNHIPLFDFGKKLIRVEDEKPLTGHVNKFVLF